MGPSIVQQDQPRKNSDSPVCEIETCLVCANSWEEAQGHADGNDDHQDDADPNEPNGDWYDFFIQGGILTFRWGFVS
jgi:hypothetical protein